MRLYRPGFPPVITDEPAQPATTPKPTGPKPFLTPEQAMLAAQSRHAATGIVQPPSSTTQFLKTETLVIPTVPQQPLIDKAAEAEAEKAAAATTVNADGLTPAEEAELEMLLAKRIVPPPK